jgi:hypothetical protein
MPPKCVSVWTVFRFILIESLSQKMTIELEEYGLQLGS